VKTDVIYNQDCIEGMKRLPNESVDLVVTSPPFNVGIEYDSWNDSLSLEDYQKFTKSWCEQTYRILKQGGRIALHLPYIVNMRGIGGRVLTVGLYWNILEKLGFKLGGLCDLEELRPQRSKLTAWGSWLSASAPYIYCLKECVLVAYKGQWKRAPGKSYFDSSKEKSREFIDLVSGVWRYRAESRPLTKAAFGLDVPLKVLKLLSYEGDIVLDPFMGSGTTALACQKLNRRFISFEISKKYWRVANERMQARHKACETTCNKWNSFRSKRQGQTRELSRIDLA
jgi:site-specific DNA-methyltransferase (adenine-specific)